MKKGAMITHHTFMLHDDCSVFTKLELKNRSKKYLVANFVNSLLVRSMMIHHRATKVGISSYLPNI